MVNRIPSGSCVHFLFRESIGRRGSAAEEVDCYATGQALWMCDLGMMYQLPGSERERKRGVYGRFPFNVREVMTCRKIYFS